MSLRKVLAMVRSLPCRPANTPVVLMGYANPIEAMGVERFAAAAAQAGVDGVLVVDYPPEECGILPRDQGAGMDPIFLLAPTSTEQRFAQVARWAAATSITFRSRA
jgi:tryptophan synthase alpha chain